jgi:flagellar biosynthesis protein FlhF
MAPPATLRRGCGHADDADLFDRPTAATPKAAPWCPRPAAARRWPKPGRCATVRLAATLAAPRARRAAASPRVLLREARRRPMPPRDAGAGTQRRAPNPAAASRQDQVEMMRELRSMRGLIEQRFGALAFMEKLQRQPRQATLSQKLLDAASRRR